MSASTVPAPAQPRRLGRSIAAFAVAIIANVVLSVGTDQVFHTLGVYPPWGEPMYGPSLNLLDETRARSGVIAVVLSALGVVASVTQELGPLWYPIALAVLAFPCVWVGAILYLHQSSVRR